MPLLPPSETPLNQHSLAALECWLDELGANKSRKDPCLWTLLMPKWSAEIKIEQDELNVSWEQKGKVSQCVFPYGLSRQDVQTAITDGP